MIKIRLHGTAAEVSAASKVIKERFNVLNCSEPYADRGESLYSRVYIDAETKTADKTLDGFRKGLESDPFIKNGNVYEKYGNAFMFATAYFKDQPVNIWEIEEIALDFALKNEDLPETAKALLELLRGFKNEV